MTRVWTYPWSVLDGGADRLAALSDRGVDGLALASHYHSVGTFEPRASDGPRFTSFPGGCYFDPPDDLFGDLGIDPPVNDFGAVADPASIEDVGTVADPASIEDADDPEGVAGVGDGDHLEGSPGTDPLDAACGVAADAGLDVTAWTVCLHNSRLGAANPSFRVEDAFGNAYDHALCPSNPAVRDYFAAVVSTLAARDVAGVDLESIGYPSVRHGHGDRFGHLKDQAVTGRATEWLCSQCFCAACRAAAPPDLDFDGARERVQSLCRQALAVAGDPLPDLATLRDENPLLARLFAFRTAAVSGFVDRLAAASGQVELNYYVAAGFGRDPGDGWPAGVVLGELDAHLDRATALCYTDDPAVARERVRAVRSATTGPVDAGVTLDPAVTTDRETFLAVADAAREATDGDLYVYNAATMTAQHLDWLSAL